MYCGLKKMIDLPSINKSNQASKTHLEVFLKYNLFGSFLDVPTKLFLSIQLLVMFFHIKATGFLQPSERKWCQPRSCQSEPVTGVCQKNPSRFQVGILSDISDFSTHSWHLPKTVPKPLAPWKPGTQKQKLHPVRTKNQEVLWHPTNQKARRSLGEVLWPWHKHPSSSRQKRMEMATFLYSTKRIHYKAIFRGSWCVFMLSFVEGVDGCQMSRCPPCLWKNGPLGVPHVAPWSCPVRGTWGPRMPMVTWNPHPASYLG